MRENKIVELKKELDSLRPISQERLARIMQKFRLDWNYHSNHLEGNSLTFGETEMLILHGVTAQGKPLKDHFEITGHDEAIKWVEEVVKSELPLTENFIRQLHSLIIKEPYEIDAVTSDGRPTKKLVEVGKYKSSPNHVKTKTGEIFYFATPEETPAKMSDLLSWYRAESESTDADSLILAASFHYKFIRIHPFDDGNGRVARILMNFILMKFGFPPVIIKTEDKENYFFALRQADNGLIENFIDYVAKNLERSLEIMIAGAKGEEIEEKEDLDKKITLLKQVFKNQKNKVKPTRTKEAILKIYDDSVKRVYEKFIIACQKFDEFYLKKEFDLFLGYIPVGDFQNLSLKFRDVLENEKIPKRITMNYKCEDFNQKGFTDFSFLSYIEMRFDLETYSLTNTFTETKIVKHYNEQISDEEISAFMKIETERHFEKIEDTIRTLK